MNNTELMAQATEMIEKGLIGQSAIATNGKLNPEQADKFIDFVMDETVLKGKVRVARLKGAQSDIDKINVGSRVAVAKAEATDPGVRRGVTTSKVSMLPKEVMVPFEISEEFEMENIEGDTVEDTIIRMMASQFANDLEEMSMGGNTLGAAVQESSIVEGGSALYVKDGFLALQDGYLKLAAASNIVDFDSENVSAQTFHQMINAMPTKFKRNRKNLKFLVPTDIEQNYRNSVSSRATAQGDAALNGTANLTPFGIELSPIPLLDSSPTIVEHVVLPTTTEVFLLNKNISDIVVTVSALAGTPTAKLILGTDYSVNAVTGSITRIGGAIGDGDTVKVTYTAQAQIILTDYRNLIFGIGRDIRIERDRDIFKSINQYAMTARIATQIEESTAAVLGKNIGLL